MKKLSLLMLLLLRLGSDVCHADYHTNTITTPGGTFAFSVDGSAANNPTISLVAGVTNILIINTSSFHPVVITSTAVTSNTYSNASPQNINSGNINLTTPTSGFPTTLYYMCKIHGFFGQINITAPPSPPPNTILKVMVGTNVVMVSTGTNTTWLLVPEYSSNLVNGAWAAVPTYTNTYANGTNTTTFSRLDPICGPNVFLRLRQQQN